MEKPTECRWCGCKEVATKTDSEIMFWCWSSYIVSDGLWYFANNCGARCVVQLMELKGRVQRAVEVLEGAARFDVIPWDGGVRRDPAADGWETDSGILNQVIEILKGKTDGKAE